ncbi:integrase [Salmonella enterica subsp. enterica serovar Typhimurium]|uniref:Integrase n=1 Tax=Salmonella enterica TaxID=28901 RepID=A0A603MI67_SALER|nr:integrase [Salmonella enterica subsp. enterica serovar Typhimurium]ECT9591851.1 integrase [Salmonella enterica]EBV1729835.1 integrase [Salmonella enterica subsp. enterica serovar Typhimurium]EBY0735383.1 integrase [Salmonella enterica subsp. enterica serovar Typhimurium]EBY9224486.1 integrase [Salmonella enterica subsp. enterica serovar Typhimurium]
MIHRYAHLAPNHLTEHARKIDDIFGDDVPNMSHMENKEEIKKRNTLIYKWRPAGLNIIHQLYDNIGYY